MAYSDNQWEVVKAFYERGLSLAEIAARHEVEIKDRKTISRKANQEGWIKGKKATLVDLELETKQKVVEIRDIKATLNATELAIHDTIVSERAQDDVLFRKASLMVVGKIIKKVQTENCSMIELKAAQEGIGKGRENIYGKTPDTIINNTNAQQTVVDWSKLSDAELRQYRELQGRVEQV